MRVSPAGAKRDLGQSERGGTKLSHESGKGNGESGAGRSSGRVLLPPPSPPGVTRGEICAPQQGGTPPGEDGRRRRGAAPVTKTHVSAGNRRSQHRGRDDDSQTAPSLRPALHLPANQSVHGPFHLQRRLVVEHTPKHLVNFCACGHHPWDTCRDHGAAARHKPSPPQGDRPVVSHKRQSKT